MLRGEPTTTVVRTTVLSLAVRLVDADTDESAVGRFAVSVEGSRGDPIEHPDGYYLFVDLDDDPVTVLVDGGTAYQDATRSVTLADLPSLAPVETVELTPTGP